MKYTWETYNADIWRNAHSDSIEECIQDAILSADLSKGDSVFIGECEPVSVSGIDFDSVLESVEQAMYDEVGEASVDWRIGYIRGNDARNAIVEKYDKKLLNLVMEYLKEINEIPSFYKVVNVQEYKI